MQGFHSDIGGKNYPERGIPNKAYIKMINEGIKAKAPFKQPESALKEYKESLNDENRIQNFNVEKKHEEGAYCYLFYPERNGIKYLEEQ